MTICLWTSEQMRLNYTRSNFILYLLCIIGCTAASEAVAFINEVTKTRVAGRYQSAVVLSLHRRFLPYARVRHLMRRLREFDEPILHGSWLRARAIFTLRAMECRDLPT